MAAETGGWRRAASRSVTDRHCRKTTRYQYPIISNHNGSTEARSRTELLYSPHPVEPQLSSGLHHGRPWGTTTRSAALLASVLRGSPRLGGVVG
eukprot:scaffold55211_cov32-Phaeocystis_antarctica.AAC.1